jgi:uncharacterized protein
VRLGGRARSGNVEDRRGRGMAVGGGLGIGGIVLLLLFSMLTGQDPGDLISVTSPPAAGTGAPGPRADDPAAEFVSVVLKHTEDTWGEIFASQGGTYRPPVLVLFENATQSACGLGESAMGPFYCPPDQRVYLDLSFFRDLSQRFGAPGDFAQAYVVAHEVGHHVQTITGLSSRVAAARQGATREQSNTLSVRQELQADCFAGVWGHYAARDGLLEEGDVEEGLRAAAAIGDDRLQQQSGGRVAPESFTHGSSEQRVTWFRRGLRSGDVNACDSFQ